MSTADSSSIIPLTRDVNEANEASTSTANGDDRVEPGNASTAQPKIDQLEEETPVENSRKQNLLLVAFAGWFETRYPRTSNIFRKVLSYVKGPQPPIISPRRWHSIALFL